MTDDSRIPHVAEAGASSVEYAMLVALVAAVVFSVVGMLGVKVFDLYDVSF